MSYNYSIDSSSLSEALSEWMKTATPEDINLALELGYINVRKVRGMVRPVVMTTTDSVLPVYRGQVGEEFVESVIRERFGEVANMTKNPKSGDLTLFIQHRKIVIEVKNYTNAVPVGGVEKFRRDLETSGAAGGVFVSLRTPISSITGDFTIRYERTELKNVPCAYIVSDSKNAIVVAVNMISQLINALSYVASETASRDRVIGGVYDMDNHVNQLTRVRHDMQTGIGDIVNMLHKTSLGVVTAESSLKQTLDEIKTELFHTVKPDLGQAMRELVNVPNYSKYTDETKNMIGSIMQSVQETLHTEDINGGMWKLSQKMCKNVLCDIGLNFLAKRVQVMIPRCKLGASAIANILNRFGNKVSIDDSVYIDLDATTIDAINELIKGGNAIAPVGALADKLADKLADINT